ncbi:alpha-glucosidase [Mycoplasmatota bacterium zrk1]
MMKKWWHKSVVYQVYPKSFYDSNGDGIGDIQGIIKKIDYLSRLGVDVLWLSPVYKSPMIDNGYDISDYQDISSQFGTMADMDLLIKEATNRNIKIIMDLVVNHTSDKHKWFRESRKSKDNKYRDYYIWRDKPNDIESVFLGDAWEYDPLTNQYYFHLFSKEQPDLNWENINVRNEISNMMNWWLEKGISGFRMDVIEFVGKEIDKRILGDGPKLHKYIREMNEKSFGKYDCLTVGETWGATLEKAKIYSNPDRNELSMIFQFEHITMNWDDDYGKWRQKPFDFIKYKQNYSKWQTMNREEGWNSLFLSNHDLPRAVSYFGNEDYRIESAKMLSTLIHFMRGTPYIYQGEEIGMTNVKYKDITSYNDVETFNAYEKMISSGISHEEAMESIYIVGRDNARTPIQWDNTKNAGFTDGNPWIGINKNYNEINVKESLENEHSIFYHYKRLISLRKESNYSNLIVYGDYEIVSENDPDVFSYIRYDGNKTILIVCNFTEKILNRSYDYLVKNNIVNNYRSIHTLSDIVLEPYESFVLEVEEK